MIKPKLIKLPDPYLEALHLLVLHRLYPNLNEAIRIAVKDLIFKHGYFRISKDGTPHFVVIKVYE